MKAHATGAASQSRVAGATAFQTIATYAACATAATACAVVSTTITTGIPLPGHTGQTRPW